MSKLSPVTTGQPTQGIGAAPVVRSVPRAVAATAIIDELESANHNDPESDSNQGHGEPAVAATPPSINPRDPYSAVRAAASAAWLSLSATELEVRKYFRTIAVPSGMEALAKMRKQCDLAAETLQQRIDLGNTERCTGCDKTLEEARKSQWIMQGSEVDPDTGVPMPYRYCGPNCVRARNREKMLPPDQRDKKRFDGEEMGDIK